MFPPSASTAETATLRVAFWVSDLSRDGPGLLLRDITRAEKEDITAALDGIAAANADVLVLQGIDWDLHARTLTALADALSDRAAPYPYKRTVRPNSGTPSGLDLDGNGRLGDPQDSLGYGKFTGHNGLAILSRYAFADNALRDFTALLWADLPGALLPYPGMPEALPETVPLASVAQFVLAIDTPQHGRLWLGAFAASPPVFDGPEDRNGRRNHDEIRFWTHLLDGRLMQDGAPVSPPPPGFVLMGNANLDPEAGAGRHNAIRALLAHPRVQDPAPEGDLGLATVRFASAGALRTSYVLPDQAWELRAGGQIHIPPHRHRLVWVDLARR